MKPQTAKEVYDKIVARINKQGGAYSSWYCGIASAWEYRLFDEHQVPREDHWWVACQCYDNESARNVEKALIELGCDGGVGGGDDTTVYVYAYLEGTMTMP
jgi:hypothetical protein